MNKNKKIIIDILLIVAVLVVISSNILNRPLGDLDEIWNYNFGNCVAKGLVPYKDFNIVQTPLLSFITGSVLILFNSLITMRILAIILCTAIIYLIYKILEKLKVSKAISIFTAIGITMLYLPYFCIDYNFFSALLILAIIYLEINLENEKKWKHITIGILAGLAFLTKQTIGAFSCVGIVLYKLIIEIYKARKNAAKIQYKEIIYRIIGGTIPVILFVIYLIINGALGDFIDYAILGIKTFSNSISYQNLIQNENVIIKILSIYIPISFILMLIFTIKKKEKNILKILTLSLAMFVLAFPISDNIHFLIGIIPAIIGNIYLLDIILRKIEIKKIIFIKFYMESLSTLLLGCLLIYGIYNIYQNLNEEKYYSKLNHFQNIPISEELEEEIIKLNEYIKNNEKKVYILNFDASIYMIPIDHYNKNYDMLLKGNIGSKGEEGIIEQIKNEKNVIYLVLNKDFNKNWQHPDKVTDFVESNLNHIGTICNFEIYN